MAHKRMFSQDITGSDAFREMPPSTQSLYFHLGMEADDDGFLDNYRGIMRAVNASDDDLKILLAKRFLILFPSKIVVVKHWRINNTIRKDRYTETKYLDEKRALLIKENGSYTEQNRGLPSGNQVATTRQPSIEENRIEKDRKDTAAAPPFVWSEYLKKMEDNKQRHVQVIAFFFKEKGIKFDTAAKVQSAIRRHLRPAKELANFSDSEISTALRKVQAEYPEKYTIETLLKVLTR